MDNSKFRTVWYHKVPYTSPKIFDDNYYSYEVYDPNKFYEKEPFEIGEYLLVNMLHTFTDIKYVAQYIILSDTKFKSTFICSNCDIPPEQKFKSYHSFELFEQNKYYEKKPFKIDGILVQNILYIVNDIKYVVRKNILSDEEYKILAPHCQCSYHKLSWYNFISKRYMCRCCVGCFDAGPDYVQRSVIKDTKEYYSKYIKNDNPEIN